MDWDIPIGTSIARRELHDRLGGGSRQDGIARVVKRNEMLVFTNDGGGEHGYGVHEGLSAATACSGTAVRGRPATRR